jgi:hypothetical protein
MRSLWASANLIPFNLTISRLLQKYFEMSMSWALENIATNRS